MRDLRLRELARDHQLRYVGHATGVSADQSELLVDGGTVAETMERIEGNVHNRRQHIEEFILQNPHAPDLQARLPELAAPPRLHACTRGAALPSCLSGAATARGRA